MMKTTIMKTAFRFTLLATILFASVMASCATAQEAQSGIDPFAPKSKRTESSRSKADLKKSSFNHSPTPTKDPFSPFPSSSSKTKSKSPLAKSKKTGPTLLQKIAYDSKRSIKKSKEFLMPWTKKKKRTFVTGMRPKPKPKKTGLFGTLFKPAKEPQRIDSVNDWFKQPRPQFNR